MSEIPGAAPAGAGVAARAFPSREAPPRSGLLSGFTRSRIPNIVVLSRQRRLPQTGHWTRASRGRARRTHCAGWPPRLIPSGIIRYEFSCMQGHRHMHAAHNAHLLHEAVLTFIRLLEELHEDRDTLLLVGRRRAEADTHHRPWRGRIELGLQVEAELVDSQ